MNDKSPLDDNWLDIAKDWQTQIYQQADIEQLISSIKWRITKSKCLLGLNIIATFALLAAFVVGVSLDWDTPLLAYLGFGVFGSGIFVAYEYKIRKVTWQYKDSTPEEVMRSVAANYRASIAYLNLNMIGFVASLPAANWFVYETIVSGGDSPVKGMVIANVAVLSACLYVHVLKRRRKKSLEEVETKIMQYFH